MFSTVKQNDADKADEVEYAYERQQANDKRQEVGVCQRMEITASYLRRS